MMFDHYHYRIIRDGDDIELRRRHLHARLAAEARWARDARSPRRGRSVPRLGTWRWTWPWRHTRPATASSLPGAVGALPATIAGAVVGLSAAGMDVEATQAAVTPEPIVEMTASSCRLADGSIGRIAIVRDADDGWSAVCLVPPAAQVEGYGERD